MATARITDRLCRVPPWPPGARGLLLAVLCVTPLFFSLGNHAILGDSEARYGTIARGMARGDTPLLVPHLFDDPHLTKPPLTYWVLAGSMRLLGPNLWALRLPSALAATMTLWVLYCFSKSVYDKPTAVVAVLLASICPLFVVMGRLATTDAMLGLLSLAALLAGASAVREGGRRWAVLLWIATALGLLTKGPAALLPVAALLLWVGWMRDRLGAGRLHVFVGLPLAMTPLLAWAGYVWAHTPDALNVWWYETWSRSTGDGDHPEPWWFFLPVLLLGFAPAWVVLGFSKPWVNKNDVHHHVSGLWLLVIGLYLVVFTVIAGKLMSYLLPLAGPVCLLAAAKGRLVIRQISANSRVSTVALRPSINRIAKTPRRQDAKKTKRKTEIFSSWRLGVLPSWRLIEGFAYPSRCMTVLMAGWLLVWAVWIAGALMEDRWADADDPADLVAEVRAMTGLETPQIDTVGFIDRRLIWYTDQPTGRIDPRVLDPVWEAHPKRSWVLLAEPAAWDRFAADPNWDLGHRFERIGTVDAGKGGPGVVRVYRTLPKWWEVLPAQSAPDPRPR